MDSLQPAAPQAARKRLQIHTGRGQRDAPNTRTAGGSEALVPGCGLRRPQHKQGFPSDFPLIRITWRLKNTGSQAPLL